MMAAAAIAAPEKTEAKDTPRGRLRVWVESRIDGVDSFEVPALVSEAATEFFGDPAWTKAMFGRLLAVEIGGILQQLRPRGTMAGDTATTKKGMKERADALARKWGGWFEHTSAGHVRLMAMTRPQLLEAAAEREARGAIEIRTAKLWRALAAQLRSDEQTVREHFRPEMIEALERDILSEG